MVDWEDEVLGLGNSYGFWDSKFSTDGLTSDELTPYLLRQLDKDVAKYAIRLYWEQFRDLYSSISMREYFEKYEPQYLEFL